MASETNNSALLDFGLEPQKEVKSEPSANPLYDFIQSENTNGHADDLLTNGDTQTLDLLDNTGDLLGDKSGDLVEGDNTEDLTKGDNSMELIEGDNSGDLLDVEGDKSGDLIEADTNGDLIEADNTEDLIKADNTEDLVKVDNTGDLIEADDSADLLGGAVTSDDSGVTMDINNVSENQKEEAEEQTDDIDEEVKVEEKEEIEEDQEPDEKKEEPVKQEPVEIKKTEPVHEENAVKVNGANEVKENGVPEDEVIRDPNVYRETREKEEVKFAELNNFREKFETGAINDSDSTPKKTSVKDEYDEGGEFENTPTVNEDVVKETDQQKEELPEIGMAKNLLNKFKSLQEESSQVKTSQKRVSPPRDEKVEYENVPEQRNLVYENKSDEGVFESTPESKEDVVRCGDKSEDVQVEKGYTKNVLSKFKEIETESSAYKAREKRELTPDTSGKVEYVSEPRGEHITYDETKVETGVFENVPKGEEDVVRSGDKAEEVLPESGMAKNLLSKFKQLESETVNQPPPSPKRTTSYEPKPREQKGYLERFSPKLEEGEFENEPVIPKEVVRSGDQQEDYKPESGAAKKTMERFKEFEKTGGSPKAPDYRKEFTPPREGSPGKTVAGVLENEPVNRPDVIRNADKTVDEMPEQGTARNMLEKFKQIQSAENSPSSSPTKKYKEFTPPPESGVYENAPKEHLVIEQVQSESGVLESTPGKSVADIPRQQRESLSPEQELPEKGMARNLVSKFKQLENESAKNSKSESPSKFKEFTPPRDTRTILSPKSPAGQQNGVHPSDLPEQYQEQTSPGIFESNPEQRKDVYRESDTDWEQGLPAKNTTLSMLQKFKAIQEKAKEDEQSQAPITRKAKVVQHE